MKNASSKHSSYAALFDPSIARAAAQRAAQWNLPRHTCHPLDRYAGRRVAADLAAFDAEVDLAPVAAEEPVEAVRQECSGKPVRRDPDFDDDEDL
jgi:hypothetical protein